MSVRRFALGGRGKLLQYPSIHSLNHFSRSGDNVVATSAAEDGDVVLDIFIETSSFADFTEVNCLHPLTAHRIHPESGMHPLG